MLFVFEVAAFDGDLDDQLAHRPVADEAVSLVVLEDHHLTVADFLALTHLTSQPLAIRGVVIGLLDPQIFVRPIEGQIDDLIGEINARIAKNERTLVTTLTKKMAEDLSAYLTNAGIRCRYLHHDIGAIERMEIIRDLRTGAFDVLVGINLLREGLDLPEVSLVAILDADKEGFLRSETSLIQTIGRAARNAEGTVIMYADKETAAMHAAIMETNRRRAKQAAYNQAHGIVPKTIVKSVRELLEISSDVEAPKRADGVKMTEAERRAEIARLEAQMKKAAEMLEYEYAAVLRDRLIELRGQ